MEYQESKKESNIVLKWLKFIFRHFDLLQVVPMFCLIGIGLAFVYSTGQQAGDANSQLFWEKQMDWAILGLFFWFFLSFLNYRSVRYWIPPLYIISIILLIAVPIWGKEVWGAKRWIVIAGFTIQPSEFAKLSVLLASAWLASMKFFDINKLRYLILLGLVAGIPFALILKQPDLGSALVLIPVTGMIIFAANIKWRYIIMAIIAVAIAVPSIYPFMHEYQKERIRVFLDPDRDPQNRGWNQLQAELAVGSGGIFGKGYMEGTQNTLGYLPKTVSNTDFIFSVIAEETGFMGSFSLVILYTLLIFAALRTAILASDDLGRYLAVGVAVMFFSHAMVNMGMSIRIMPVTGIPLPFISYGGSFMLTCLVCMGILQSVYSHRKTADFE